MITDKQLLADVIEWDTVNWSKALPFWSSRVDLQSKPLSCLELGSRGGGLSLWLALQGNQVICSDVENPREQAIKLHGRYDCGDRITYEAVDATDILYKSEFDVIAFKSILGGISRDGRTAFNQIVIDKIYEALKPEGALLFAENLGASPLHHFFRTRFVRWGTSWNYLDLNEIPSLFRQFADVKYTTAGFLGAFGRTESHRRLLGRIDTAILDRMIPPRFQYIVFGVAFKA